MRLLLATAAVLFLVTPGTASASDSSATPSALTSGVTAAADTTGYSVEPTEPNTHEPFTQQCGSPYNVGVARTAWYTVQGAGGQVTITTGGSDFDTALFVYTGSPGGVIAACNDDRSDSDTTSSVSFPSTTGTTYFIQVGRACNEVGPPKCAANPPSGNLQLTATALSPTAVGDADHDGYVSAALGGPDCDDGNPAIHPGVTDVPHDGIDQDCSGKDAPYPRLRVTTTVSVGYGRTFTIISALKLTGALPGSRIRISCASRRLGCRFAHRSVSVGSSRPVQLGKYLKRARYKRGAAITLQVSKPGYIGAHIRYTIRLRRLPTKTTRCTEPGQNTPRTACS